MNYSFVSKKPWCSTQYHYNPFYGDIGRGRCRLDCDGRNLETESEYNLATLVIIIIIIIIIIIFSILIIARTLTTELCGLLISTSWSTLWVLASPMILH